MAESEPTVAPPAAEAPGGEAAATDFGDRRPADRFRRVGRMSALYLAGAVLARISKFLLVPFYVRFLTKAEVGTVVLLVVLQSALARLFPMGLGNAIQRFYPEFPSATSADQYTAGLWWVVFAMGAAWAGLAWATVPVWSDWIDPSIPMGFMVLAVAAAAFQGTSAVATMRFIARQEPIRHTAYTTLELLASTAAVIVLVAVFDLGVAGVLWGMVGGYSLFAVASGALTHHWARWRPRLLRFGESLRYAVSVVPHLLFVWGITFADRLLLVQFVDLEEVGVYGVGYQLGTVATVFTVSVTNAWLARFFRASEGEAGAREYSATLTRLAVMLLWITLGTVALAPEVIAVVATAEYADSVGILQLVAVGYVFHGLTQAFLLPLFLKAAGGRVSVSTGIGLAVNVGMNLLLLPWLGITGAAIATVGAFAASAIMAFVYAQRVYPFKLERWRLGVASGLAAALCIGSLLIDEIGWIPTTARGLLVVAYPAVLWFWPGRPVITAEERDAVVSRVGRYLRH